MLTDLFRTAAQKPLCRNTWIPGNLFSYRLRSLTLAQYSKFLSSNKGIPEQQAPSVARFWTPHAVRDPFPPIVALGSLTACQDPEKLGIGKQHW
jgi:hypothetical protein